MTTGTCTTVAAIFLKSPSMRTARAVPTYTTPSWMSGTATLRSRGYTRRTTTFSRRPDRAATGLSSGAASRGSAGCPTPTTRTPTILPKAKAAGWCSNFGSLLLDYAPYEGPERAVVSKLVENALIGLSWAVLDYDENNSSYEGFWNLSHKTRMDSDASNLCAFRLMPLASSLRQPLEAQWEFQVVDMERRLVAFKDLSHGTITSWSWDFDDGTTSARTTSHTPVQRSRGIHGRPHRPRAGGHGAPRQSEASSGALDCRMPLSKPRAPRN